MKHVLLLVMCGLLCLQGPTASAQSNRPVPDDPELVSPPRKVGDQGYGAGGVQDSVLAGGPGVGLPGSSVGIPNPCDFDPDRCAPSAGGGNEGTPPAATAIYSTCTFSGSASVSVRQQTRQNGCSQGGNFVGMTSATISAVFVVGDTADGSGTSFSTSMSDENKYEISWSGDCSGSGRVCQTGSKTADWRGNGAAWSATYRVVERSTGAAFSGNVNARFSPCGAVVGSRQYECP